MYLKESTLCQQMKQHLISLKIYATMHWRKISEATEKYVRSNKQHQKKEERLYSLAHHTVFMFQQILVKIIWLVG